MSPKNERRPQPVDQPADDAEPIGARRRKLQVVIIEDDADVAEVLGEMCVKVRKKRSIIPFCSGLYGVMYSCSSP